jgi:ankyrin repeat protein
LYGVYDEFEDSRYKYWPICEDASPYNYIFDGNYAADWLREYFEVGYKLKETVMKDMRDLSRTVPGIIPACFAAFICCYFGSDYRDSGDQEEWHDVRLTASETISRSIARTSEMTGDTCGLALWLLYDDLLSEYPAGGPEEHLPEITDQARNVYLQIEKCGMQFQATLSILARQLGGSFEWPSRFLENPIYFRNNWWPLYAGVPDNWHLRDSAGRLALHVVLEGLKKNNSPPSLQSDSARQDLFKRILAYVKERPGKLCTDRDGRSPLHFAIQIGLEDLAMAMISERIGIDAEDADGRSPLHYAVVTRSSKLVSLLMQKGADPGCLDKCRTGPGRSPLAYLFWTRSMEDHKSELNHMRGLGSKFSRTAAAEAEDLSILDCFIHTLGNGINSYILEDADGVKITALAAAVDQLWVAGMHCLVGGADLSRSVRYADGSGSTILHFAVKSLLRRDKCEKEDISTILVQIGFLSNLPQDIADCANVDGHTTLTFLADQDPTRRQLQIAEQFLLQPWIAVHADQTNVKHRHWTPLHYAAAHDNVELCRLLCSRNDSGLLVRDDYGMTPMDVAARKEALGAYAVLENALGRSA